MSAYISGFVGTAVPPTTNTDQRVQFNGSNYVLLPGASVVTPGAYPYNVVSSDTLVLASAAAGNVVVQLPSAASFPGRRLDVNKTDSTSNLVNVTPNGTDTILGVNAAVSLVNPNQNLTLESITTGWVVI